MLLTIVVGSDLHGHVTEVTYATGNVLCMGLPTSAEGSAHLAQLHWKLSVCLYFGVDYLNVLQDVILSDIIPRWEILKPSSSVILHCVCWKFLLPKYWYHCTQLDDA